MEAVEEEEEGRRFISLVISVSDRLRTNASCLRISSPVDLESLSFKFCSDFSFLRIFKPPFAFAAFWFELLVTSRSEGSSLNGESC